MKLLYVSLGCSPHDIRFLEAFDDAGFVLSHLRLTASCTDTRPLPARVRTIAWEQSSPVLTSSDCARLIPSFERVLSTEQPDVILAGPVPTAAYLVALAGFRRFVAMSWGTDMLVDVRDDSSARAAARYALERAGGAFGDCQAVADAFLRLVPVPRDRLAVFPWGIDLRRFSPGPTALSLRERLGWRDKRVLLCTRSWEPGYGMDILLRAVASAAREHPDCRLLLVGDGSLHDDIVSLIEQLQLSGIVHAMGRLSYDALPDIFRLADVYVSAALSDGTSVSLLEAMACGLPAIVTDGYGNPEWVHAGENGWLAKPGDVSALAETIRQALSAPESRILEMKHANLAHVRARADWSKNIPQLIRLLRKVAGDRPAAPQAVSTSDRS